MHFTLRVSAIHEAVAFYILSDIFIKYTTVSKKSIHFCRTKYSNLRGQMEKKDMRPTLYWVVKFEPSQWWVCCILYFSFSPHGFWVLAFDASVYFLLLETVCIIQIFWYIVMLGLDIKQNIKDDSFWASCISGTLYDLIYFAMKLRSSRAIPKIVYNLPEPYSLSA